MSTRSPKDSVIKCKEFKDELMKNLKTEENEACAVVKTFNQLQIAKTGQQAIDLIKNSERIFVDMSRTLLYLDEKLKKDPKAPIPEQIIVRKFYKNIITQVRAIILIF